MFLYENNKCPVCNKEFAEGDDVVSCPECGTPHHRECYKSIGKCANVNLHGTDFVYDRNNYDKNESVGDIAEMQSIQQFAEEVYQAVEESENVAKDMITENQPDAAFETAEKGSYIDGVSSSDIETVVGVNSEVFIKKFSKKRKLSWNWSAFFFGPYYFMYRKMFMESFIFLVLPWIVLGVVGYVFKSAALVLNNIFTEISKYLYEYDFTGLLAYAKESIAAPENKEAWTAILVILGSSLILSIVAAVIANNQYRKRVVKIIKTVDEKVDLGESFSFVGPIMGNENMSQSDLRKMFLAKQGGVNIIFPFVILLLEIFSQTLY